MNWHLNQNQQSNQNQQQMYYSYQSQQLQPPPPPQPIYPVVNTTANYPFQPPPNQMHYQHMPMNYNASAYSTTTPIQSNNMGLYGAPPQYQPPYPFLHPHTQPNKKSKPNPPTNYTCQNCNNQQFPNLKAYQKHLNTHKKCSQCTYTASPKYLSIHYSTHHGKYSGRGLKPVTIDLPGSKSKTFRICVGNHPEDIKLWIEERKKNFPTRKRIQEKKEKGVIASLVSGYSSESDTERKNTTKTKLCTYYQRGKCIHGENCKFIHDSNPPKPEKKRDNKKVKKQSLLEKMVHSEMQREQYLTLQCLQILKDEGLLE